MPFGVRTMASAVRTVALGGLAVVVRVLDVASCVSAVSGWAVGGPDVASGGL